MANTVSDALIDRLIEWGVDRVFGYPGDGINGVMGALRRRADAIDFVQTRHEEMAAFMACAHAKFARQTAICMATSGPGAIHLLAGLYDAKLDHQPVVAIVGQQSRSSLGGSYQQEVDLAALFKDVASPFVQMVVAPPQLRHAVDRAMRIASAESTVTAIILPNDLQELDAEPPQHEHGTVHSGVGYSRPHLIPRDEDLRHAAEVLNEGTKVAMLVGAGALDATDEIVAVADVLGAGIAKALLGKAAVPDDARRVTGSIGPVGTEASYHLMMECDTLLMVGSGFPYSEFLPKEGKARGVQIDIDNSMLSLRYPMEVTLVGDSAETLRHLLPLLERKDNGSWRSKIDGYVDDWRRKLERRARNRGNPINPQRIFWDLSPRLPDGCIVTCDSGSAAVWYARYIKFREGMMGSLSGGLASMGCAMPYAIAAKLAFPSRPVLALVGDGAMQMNGINELITLSKYRNRFSDQRLVVVVLNNRDLNMVTWEQRRTEGDPDFTDSQSIPDFPYADYARLLGFGSVKIEQPDDIPSALDEAFSASGPFLIEACTDPNVPLSPPHLTLRQAKALAKSLLKGDPQAAEIIRASYRELYPTHR
ncbi:MAG TPA: thiamine pyrophosphate-requiring protein [Casimicrobiaceae bacterium]|nr:thiamine pyrophosphate-requiring protein [Casimicrobiaceae bacterium]